NTSGLRCYINRGHKKTGLAAGFLFLRFRTQRPSNRKALLAFGEHYRSVLATPEGSDHGNIRALIEHGLAGVKFAAQPLTRR
ncbi:HopJ type III effector protein, partial [Pseudomonas sp. IPO3778]|uniref:HopJ type III effector protein n=1 Tax=Pseudomonas sp. IPO3778 TaxID=2726976 RepID=UPI0015BA7488